MKQKIVIKLLKKCDKCRSKALKLAAATARVESVSITGKEKDELEVVGDEVDPVKLTRRLRKKVVDAELVSVSEAKEKEKKDEPAALAFTVGTPYFGYPPYSYLEATDPTCAIL